MEWEPLKPLQVSIHGVSRIALFLGRACALKDRPILGVYDSDAQKALRAALYLGVSARATTESFLKDGPTIIISSLPDISPLPSDALLIQLVEVAGDPAGPNLCWAVCDRSDDEIPEQISSESPLLKFTLGGDPEAVRLTTEFFRQLPADIQVSNG